MKKINFGILSAGAIAHEFCDALLQVGEARIYAVASRDIKKAKGFADQFSIPVYYDNYAALASDQNIDIIYVCTPHLLHYEHTMMCLEAGKNVLCEKPLAVSPAQAEEMAALARKKNVFLMEGMWTRFLPAIVQAKKWVEEGEIGELKVVRAEISSMETDKTRWLWNKDMCGGSLYDVGAYPVSLASYFFESAPEKIVSLPVFSDGGIDEYLSMSLTYPGRRIASLTSTLPLTTDSTAHICGTEGYIEIPRFWQSDRAILVKPGMEKVEFLEPFDNGFIYEIKAVINSIKSGLVENRVMPLDESISVIRTMERIKDSWKRI